MRKVQPLDVTGPVIPAGRAGRPKGRFMRRSLLLLLVCLAGSGSAPAQTVDPAKELVERYVAAFNRGDAALLARDIFAPPDASEEDIRASFAAEIDALRKEDFGRLDAYDVAACPVSDGRTRAILRFAHVYTFGGTMPPGDQAMLFELVLTQKGWRIVGRTIRPFETTLDCSG